MVTVYQPSFSGGELSSSLYGRVDLAIYQTCLKTCYNFIPQAYGGIKNRQGTRYIGAAYSTARESRLVPFTFNAEQSYVLEIVGGIAGNGDYWDGYIRVLSRGKLVADSGGTPIVIPAPWKGTDTSGNSLLRQLKFSQSADVMTVTHQGYPPFQIKRYAHDSWVCVPYLPKVGPWEDLNTEKGITIWSDGSEDVVTVKCNNPVFKGRTGQYLRIKQKDFGQAWEPSKAVVVGDVRRSDGKYYRAATAGTTGTLRPTHDADSWNDGGVFWEYLHSGHGHGLITAEATDGLSATMSVRSRLPDASSLATASPTVLTITGVAEAGSGNILLTVPGHGQSVGANITVTGVVYYFNAYSELRTYSFYTCPASVASTSTLELDRRYDQISDFNIIDSNYSTLTRDTTSQPGEATATYKWSFSAWGGPSGWPACSSYFQQRHCFAATPNQPQAVWMSRTADYSDFSESEPIADDDTVTFTVASAQIDGVTSMLPMDKLVLFTLGGNWVLGGGQDDLITPANTPVKLQNYFGSSPIGPLGIGNAVLYHGRGGTIRDMAYDFASDSYVGNDLLVKAAHMYKDYSMLEWAFQESPFPIVWTVRDDGMLVTLTYLKEEKVIGWARQYVGGTVHSVAVINECGEDHVYLVVSRGGTKNIEVLYGRVDDLYEACFLDSALTYDGRNTLYTCLVTVTGSVWTAGNVVTVTASGAGNTPFTGASDVGDHVVLEDSAGTRYRIEITAFISDTVVHGELVDDLPVELRNSATSSWGIARDTFTSLGHLEGMDVGLYSDGEYSTGTVSSGQVSISPPGLVVTVGVPMRCEATLLDITMPEQPHMEVRKLVPLARLLVEASRSTYVGTNANDLQEVFVTDPGDTMTGLASGTGLMEGTVRSSWNYAGSFSIVHTKPYPLSILAVLPEVVPGMP